MKYLFKNLKQYWKSVVLLAVLLLIQGFCEMSMPQYTQNIIDVGIQNKGITHILPAKVTAGEFERAQVFMDEVQKQEWREAYSEKDGVYELQDLSEETLDGLDKSLLTPVVLAYQLGHMTEDSFRDMMKAQIQSTLDMQKDLPDFARKAAEAQMKALDGMSAEEIADALGMDITTFEAKDEDGNMAVYVDVRPAMQSLLESGQMSEDQTAGMKKQISETVEAIGDRTMRAMGIQYAADAAEAAGVDVDRQQKDYLWQSGGRMILMALIMAIAAVAVSFVASRVGSFIGRDLRRKVFGNVISYSNAEMDKFQTSSLITRATNDVQQVQMVTTMLLRMVLYAPVLGIWGVFKVWQSHANMSWIIILGIAVIVGMIMTLMFFAMPKFKIMQKMVDRLNGVSREILTGLMVVRAFGREKTEEKRFDDANSDLMRTQLFTNRVMTFMMPSMMFIMSGLGVLITWVAAHRVDSGVLEVGAMTSFITYSMIIISSFMILTAMSIILPRAGVAAERINEVVTTKSSILEPEEPQVPEEQKGLVEFDHVNFRYPGAEEDALQGITFAAEPGKTTAIIGSTGSGKSTLVNLIPRFYDVTGGSIRMDGVDIRQMDLRQLRDEIGFVPQKGTLFSGTIASNIRFGRPDAPDFEVERAARIAQSDDFIGEKEEGYSSHISQGGSNVSGGQKQRLSIARAIAKRPKVLVFDDSFSALDMKTDAKLREVLAEEEKDATRIIVAQRVSTILNADQILVIDEGKIVGTGTHTELLDSCEVYRQIASSQLSAKELEETRQAGKDAASRHAAGKDAVSGHAAGKDAASGHAAGKEDIHHAE